MRYQESNPASDVSVWGTWQEEREEAEASSLEPTFLAYDAQGMLVRLEVIRGRSHCTRFLNTCQPEYVSA
jgi:hypothetical protein